MGSHRFDERFNISFSNSYKCSGRKLGTAFQASMLIKNVTPNDFKALNHLILAEFWA